MASEVDICNLSLGHCNNPAQVSAINPPDGSNEAKQCARFYPIARDEALVDFKGNFSIRYATLAPLSSDPDSDWLFRFALPNDYLDALELTCDGFPDPQDFEVTSSDSDGEILQTNTETPLLKYVARIVLTGLFPPKFVTALSYNLASYLAGPITKKREKAEEMKKLYIASLAEASVHDANSKKAGGPRQRQKDYRPKGIVARD